MSTYSDIAYVAVSTRNHLVDAIRGLDEIIRLADEADESQLKAAAQAAKAETTKAAKAFNAKIDDAGGDARKIDPIAIDDAEAAATAADKRRDDLLKQLDERVKSLEDRLNTWGFGPNVEAPTQNSWADKVQGTLASHGNAIVSIQKDVDELKTRPSGGFPFNAFWGGLIALLGIVIIFAIMFLIADVVFSTALLWAVTIGLAAGIVGGLLTAGLSEDKK